MQIRLLSVNILSLAVPSESRVVMLYVRVGSCRVVSTFRRSLVQLSGTEYSKKWALQRDYYFCSSCRCVEKKSVTVRRCGFVRSFVRLFVRLLVRIGRGTLRRTATGVGDTAVSDGQAPLNDGRSGLVPGY